MADLFTVRATDIRRDIDRQKADYRKRRQAAALYATDAASREAQTVIRSQMVEAGLGNLGRAVGQTSALKKRQTKADPYGVIFAKGGDDSRAGGALDIYRAGGTIRTRQQDYLWIPTQAVPRLISIGGKRQRLTPALYNRSGLVATIGPLVFRPIKRGRALLVVKRVSISPKNGRAKALGKRPPRSRIPLKEVVAFIGIRQTLRAKRIDKDGPISRAARKVPRLMAAHMEENGGNQDRYGGRIRR